MQHQNQQSCRKIQIYDNYFFKGIFNQFAKVSTCSIFCWTFCNYNYLVGPFEFFISRCRPFDPFFIRLCGSSRIIYFWLEGEQMEHTEGFDEFFGFNDLKTLSKPQNNFFSKKLGQSLLFSPFIKKNFTLPHCCSSKFVPNRQMY